MGHLHWARPVSDEAQTLRFLVVDDNEDICDMFCRLVQRAGHLASVARDGLEALDSLQRESFDVMLLDLSMPRMNGVEVVRGCATIRPSPRTCGSSWSVPGRASSEAYFRSSGSTPRSRSRCASSS